MSISLKSRKQIVTPRLDDIKDPAVAQVLNDFAKIISDMTRNIFDDLTTISTTSYVDSIYFGDASTNGSWRILKVGNDLSIQRREAGVWVEKDLITA